MRFPFLVPVALAVACVSTPASTPDAPAAASAASSASSDEPALRVADLYPLAVGNTWTYDSISGGVAAKVTIRILNESGGYFVDSAGGALRVDAFGLRDPKRYLLREPLVAGTRWTSVQSLQSTEQYQITEAGRPCTVPAGTFARCVRVSATNKSDAQRTLISTWTYAEGVGLVELQTAMQVAGKPPQVQVEARLEKFVPAR